MHRTVLLLAFLGTAGFALAQSADEARPPYCGPNEHYETNSYTRQLTCYNMELGPIIGPGEPTTSACFCNGGYVRNGLGICIKIENCPIKTCPLNEHYEKESNRCQITCANMYLEPIMGPCGTSSACFCNEGYVRNDNGICIKRENCPPRCPPFEQYFNQTSQCQATCRNPYLGPCWRTSGCFCLPGYVRNDAGICIRWSDCPLKTCPLNEHYETNTNRCQITCAIMHLEPIMGPCSTSSACFCNGGYVRNDKGICIKRGSCPTRCPPFEQYFNQTSQCQATCRNPYLGPCWRTSGCFCLPGYVRNDAGVCIRWTECPSNCKKGEVYTDCGSSCPETCQTRGDTCQFCTAQCVSGCFCAPGTIRAPDGTCVPPKMCPPRTCSGQNEEFVDCPPTCPPTENCSNIWSRFDCSNPIDCCKPSCRCKSGFYRNNQGVCISTQQCMNNQSGNVQTQAQADATAAAYATAAVAGATAEARA